MSRYNLKRMGLNLLLLAVLALLIAAITCAQSLWAEDVPTFTAAERRQALAEARKYTEVEYHHDGKLQTGVAFLHGGQDSVSEFLMKIQTGGIPGVDAGIDASGLVVNAYRAVYPDLKFAYQTSALQRSMVRDASSQMLYQWNVKPIQLDELTLGDLVFLGNSPNQITGVGLYAGRHNHNLRIIIASASKQKVVETGIIIGGEYWNNHVVGLGRLIKW